ncbi:MAG TPA: protein kinase [Vicinamibacterales bacterium]|nr:protein kinase [Vicinamibacterales bacterium]
MLEPIGAGGMGEVYLARDTRLGREVAIKVLPADRMHDEGRRRRFLQEAQSASALNHPHIVTIHHIESEGAIDFIVMEYVRGATLDTVIPRQGLGLNELLRIAIPVTDAVAAAHTRGIIHRDLKPANVMVGEGGSVKVLDFGLAKLMGDDDSSSSRSGDAATVTQFGADGLSAPGAILGTVAYMAPEQAAGGKVDARGDIFSFGAMLYEMATGTKAFAGPSVADTLANVLRAEPTPPTQIAATLPRELERLILRCLKKEPDRRYQLMLDVRNELQEIKQASDSGTLGAPTPVPGRRRTLAIAGAVLAVAIVAAGAIALRLLRPHAEPDLPPMKLVPLTSLNGTELWPRLSPDGDYVAFSWSNSKEGFDHFDIYLKQVGSSDVRRLTTEPGAFFAGGWSPDGRQLACVRYGPEMMSTIYLISPLTGTQRKLMDFPASGATIWTNDGQSLIGGGWSDKAPEGVGIYLIPVDGGTPRRILPAPKGVSFISATALAPDGHHLAYLSCGANGCTLIVTEFDDRWQPVSAPRQLANRLKPQGGLAWAADSASVIYVVDPAPETCYLWRAWIRGDRAPERVEVAGLGARMPSLSAARNRLAFTRYSNSIGVHTLGPVPRPVLVNAFWDIQPQFSPDGTRLVFTSSRSGEGLEVWLAEADGSNAHQLTHGPGRYQGSPSWSPDGRRIAFDSKDADQADQEIWTIDADGGNARVVVKGSGDHGGPAWSRDGRWIYFWGGEPGSSHDTWRVPATGGSPERVTRDGSFLFAFESPDGLDLIFKRDREDSPLLAQPLNGGPVRQLLPCVTGVNFAAGPSGLYYAACGPGPLRSIHLLDKAGRDRVLGTASDPWGYPFNRLAVSPDGKTILIQQGTKSNDLMVIENFR